MARRGGEFCTVRLLDVPAAAFMRLQLHVDDLLRELEIIAIGQDSGAVVVPPEMREVICELFAVQGDGVEPTGRDRLDLELLLPDSAAAATDELAELLDRADELSRAGVLLTTPTPVELVALRRWMAVEVGRQLRDGADPAPYVNPPL